MFVGQDLREPLDCKLGDGIGPPECASNAADSAAREYDGRIRRGASDLWRCRRDSGIVNEAVQATELLLEAFWKGPVRICVGD